MKDPRDDWKNLRHERAKIEEAEHSKMVVSGLFFWFGLYAVLGFFCFQVLPGLDDDDTPRPHHHHAKSDTGLRTGGGF